jgi:hypothetical protein
MKMTQLLKRPTELFEVATAPDESGYTLNVAGVYQDTVTRDWAMQSYLRATRLAGEEHVQNTWHDVNSLSDPAILLDAVRAALVADVIVVSVYAADELPLDLYAWVAAWLPRRLSRAGALTALVGVAEPLDSQFVRTIEYLEAVARKAQLDFVPQERQRTVAAPVAIKPIAASAGASAPSLEELNGQRYFAFTNGD